MTNKQKSHDRELLKIVVSTAAALCAFAAPALLFV